MSPNCNPWAERFVRTAREECLNHFVIFGPTPPLSPPALAAGRGLAECSTTIIETPRERIATSFRTVRVRPSTDLWELWERNLPGPPGNKHYGNVAPGT